MVFLLLFVMVCVVWFFVVLVVFFVVVFIGGDVWFSKIGVGRLRWCVKLGRVVWEKGF